jgi:hypothetical protein
VSARRPQPGLPIFLVSAVLCLALVVAASVFSSRMQFGAVHATFRVAVAKVAQQVKTDAAAHVALQKVESSDFAASTGRLVAALKPCIGPAAVAPTTSSLKQLAGFRKLVAAPRDVLPAAVAAGDDADEVADVQQMADALQTDKARTGETQADIQANLIGQDEVNQDLDAIAAGVGSTAHELVSKDGYASTSVKSAYATSVSNLATVVAKIAPSLKAKRAVKITSTQSDALQTLLGFFATACKSEASSSAANTPRAVTIAYLPWGSRSWPVENFPYSMTLKVKTAGTPTPGCTSTRLLAEGIATGGLSDKVTVTVPGTDPSEFKVLTHYTSATSAQWAVVACAS